MQNPPLPSCCFAGLLVRWIQCEAVTAHYEQSQHGTIHPKSFNFQARQISFTARALQLIEQSLADGTNRLLTCRSEGWGSAPQLERSRGPSVRRALAAQWLATNAVPGPHHSLAVARCPLELLRTVVRDLCCRMNFVTSMFSPKRCPTSVCMHNAHEA